VLVHFFVRRGYIPNVHTFIESIRKLAYFQFLVFIDEYVFCAYLSMDHVFGMNIVDCENERIAPVVGELDVKEVLASPLVRNELLQTAPFALLQTHTEDACWTEPLVLQ